MAIYNGNKLAKKLYVGNKPVRAVYAGSQKVWPSIPDDEILFNGLRWKRDNLAGKYRAQGKELGTEYGGNWYYNYLEANAIQTVVGGGWRLPTEEEFNALPNATVAYKDNSYGFLFTSDEGGALFFPFNGFIPPDGNMALSVSEFGNYWTSTPDTENGGYNFTANMGIMDSGLDTQATDWNEKISVRLVHDL